MDTTPRQNDPEQSRQALASACLIGSARRRRFHSATCCWAWPHLRLDNSPPPRYLPVNGKVPMPYANKATLLAMLQQLQATDRSNPEAVAQLRRAIKRKSDKTKAKMPLQQWVGELRLAKARRVG
jgi:hypothetical protein